MATKAKIEANRRWDDKAYRRITVRIKRESESVLKARCEELGKTEAQYINWLISNDIEGFEPIGEATKKGDKRK